MKTQPLKPQQRSYALSSLQHQPLVARTVGPEEIVVLDWKQRQPLAQLRSQGGPIRAVALHPEGQRVALAGEQNQVEVWDTSGKILASRPQAALGLRFTPCGNYLLLGAAGSLTLWDWQADTVVWEKFEPQFRNPSILDCHQDRLLWSAMGSSSLLVLDLRGDLICRWDTQDEWMAACFHPDGKRLAASLNTVRSPLLHQISLFQLGQEQPLREFPIPFISICLALSPGGGTLASGDSRGVQLWDTASGAPEKRLAPRQQHQVKDFGTVEQAGPFLVTTLGFCSSDQQLISDGDAFCHWDLSQEQPLWRFP